MSQTATKRLVAYHIGRLRDNNRDVRLKSIRELADLADPDALPALQSLYQTEEDAEVKRAAQEAGRTIFLRNRT